MNPDMVWEKYKSLELWKRVLLIVPALVAIALIAVYFFIKPQSTDIADDMLQSYQDQTDDTLVIVQEEIDRLVNEGETLEEERLNLKEEMKKNGQITDDTSALIDTAADLAELERIRINISERVNLYSE